MAFEVITTDDKEQRDRLFDEYRKSDDSLERQVVKFSSVREVPPTQAGEVLTYRSTWSIAHPTS